MSDPPSSSTSASESEKLAHVGSGGEKSVAGTSGDVAEVEVEYVKGVQLALLIVALSLTVLLVALDNLIVTTAIPKITDDFNSLADVGWVRATCVLNFPIAHSFRSTVARECTAGLEGEGRQSQAEHSSYFLGIAATQLLFGKFYTLLPKKGVFIVAIILFEIGSAVCGAAKSSNALIVGRAIAGLGSAGEWSIFGGAFVIISECVALPKRPMFNGLFGAMYGVASVAGPLVGGAFTDKVTWRWQINLPIGGISLAFLLFFFHMPAHSKPATREGVPFSERLKEFDPLGTITFIPAIVCLLLGLQWGGSKYPWHDGRIIALFTLFGVLLAAFLGIQLFIRQEQATVPPHVMRQRSMAAGVLFTVCQGGSFFLFVYYLPIWFQAIKGASPLKSGIDCIPLDLAVVIAVMFTRGAVSKSGYYTPFMIISSVLMPIGAGLLTTFTVSTGHAHWIGYQVLYGLGVGFGLQLAVTAAQAVLHPKDIAIGMNLITFAQMLGGAVFVAVGQNVFQNKLIHGIAANVPGVDPHIVLNTGATSLQDRIPPQYIGAVLFEYNAALMAAFQVGLILACISILGSAAMEWVNIKGRNVEMGGIA
ncbi:unnamed protein product [Mycena citricolor]|uniref:Major facilitator superfamily (MFS) profile domain-containing protein n=1 Tax=Mycena citricolor TaxID=2018698 RepID=A0AAD2Q6T6_9AGAR|nr:unnamed protein product [Mycena citricolor]